MQQTLPNNHRKLSTKMLHPGTSNIKSSFILLCPKKWLQNLQGTWCWPPPHGTRCSFQWTTPGRHFLPVQLQVGHGWRFLGWRRDEKSWQVASLSSGIHGVYPYTRCRCMATIHPSNLAASASPKTIVVSWFRHRRTQTTWNIQITTKQ